MTIYTFNSLVNYNQGYIYNQDVAYNGSNFSAGVAYNTNLNYNSPFNYNAGSVVIGVGHTLFEFIRGSNTYVGDPTSGIQIPCKAFTIYTSADTYKVSYVEFSGEPIPGQHIEDAQLLDADAYIDLFQITLSDRTTTLYFKMNTEATWQGNTYESNAIKIDGVGKYADDEVARPKLSLFNPEGVYSSLVDGGLLDAATIVRYRVLKYDVDNDRPIYRRQQWKVSRIASIVGNAIILELRDLMDGQIFSVPGRMFIPPEFPTVGI